MADPTTSIRVRMKRRLYDLLLAEAPDRIHGQGAVQVLYGPDMREIQQEVIWLGAINGQNTYPVMGGGAAVRRNDEFTIDVWCGVRVDGLVAQDPWSADEQCERMAAALENLLRTSPQLGGGGSYADAEPGVIHALVGQFDGPSYADLTEGGMGVWSSAALIKVEITARLS